MIARAILRALSPAGRRARLMIFPYHRVLENHDPLLPGTPDAGRFERQLKWVKKYCNPLPMDEAISRLAAGTLPDRAITLTFDDGYANNLSVAAPLLKRYEIPAIVFLTVDALERGIMWNDLIVEAVRNAKSVIDATWLGAGVLEVNDTNKLDVLSTLINAIQYEPTDIRLDKATRLYENQCDYPWKRQMLRPDELTSLIEHGVSLGAHTVTHPILTTLADHEARDEIENSRTWIEKQTGTTPDYFAYPRGKFGTDYSQRHSDIVRDLGFAGAVSADWGCATSNSSLFDLPRFKPWEDSDWGFGTRLCKVVAQTYV